MNECFPEPLRYEVAEDGSLTQRRAEPIAADFRLPDGTQGWTSPEAYRQDLQARNLGRAETEHLVGEYRERLNLMKLKLVAGI